MNRLATVARIAGIVTVSVFVVLVTRTPSPATEIARVESTAVPSADSVSTYLPAHYIDEEKAAYTSELPAQF